MKDERNISEQIVDLIDRAMLSRDFGSLNQQISDILNPGGSDYRPLEHMINGTSYRQGYYGQSRPADEHTYYRSPSTPFGSRQDQAMNAAKEGRAAYDARRQSMMAGQPHYASQRTGYGSNVRLQNSNYMDPNYFVVPQTEEKFSKLMVTFGMIAVIINGFRLFGAVVDFSGLGDLVSALVGLGISGLVVGVGSELQNRIGRFKKYVGRLKDKFYATVSDLARAVGKNDDYTRRDLQKMIQKGMFREGHLDDTQTTMIASNALYDQYRSTQQAAVVRQQEKEAREDVYGKYPPEVRKVLKKGDEYIEKIREANAALPEENITEKLSRLEMIITKIFAQVKKEPSEARNLSQFMDYYLPTTWKLIEAYREMEEQPIRGDNIQTAKKEILESLDTINDAFETLLDSMFKDKAWDVSTDISVMKSMMKQEGLMGSDFKAHGGAAAQAAPAKRGEPVKEVK